MPNETFDNLQKASYYTRHMDHFDATAYRLRRDTSPLLLTRQDLAGLRSAAWRETLASFGVHVVRSVTDIQRTNQLYVTNCCGTKGIGIPHGTPDVFYLGAKQQNFYASMRRERFEWAILSDLYGMHFSDESLPLYDLHPGQLTQDGLWALGALIRRKLFERYGGLPEIVYCKAPISTAVPYVIMMLAAGVELTLSLSANRR